MIKNETEIIQVYYNRFRDPIELMPGDTYEEDLSKVIGVNEFIGKEKTQEEPETNVNKLRKIKRFGLNKSVDTT